MQEIRCDILVIGAGAAGSRAAYEAKRAAPELDVLLACNGKIGGSGSTNLDASEALGINAPFNYMRDADNADTFFDDIMATGDGLASPSLSRVIADESCVRLEELMRLGVRFEEKDGLPRQQKLSGCTRARSLTCGGGTGLAITGALTKGMKMVGVKFLENARLLDLRQTADCAVCGAAGFIGREPVSIAAKAVVLATGGAGRLFARSVNTSDIQGDGWAMACAAGARFINMEFFQVGPAVVHPPMKFIIHSHMWRLKPNLTNGAGQAFLPNYCPPGISASEALHLKAMSYPFSVRTPAMYVDIAIFKEIISGRGTPHNGVYFDVTHTSREEFLEKAPITYQRLKSVGIDLTTDKLELGLAVQNFNGGILIDEHGFTGVQGLFAAGEVSGGVHGSDRPGGNNLTDTQVFGYRAGVAAARAARSIKASDPAAPDAPLVGKLEMNARDEEIIQRSAELFYREMTIVRNARGLQDVLDFTNCHLKEGLGLEARNRLLVGQLLATAMLLREESRGDSLPGGLPRSFARLDQEDHSELQC